MKPWKISELSFFSDSSEFASSTSLKSLQRPILRDVGQDELELREKRWITTPATTTR